MSAGRVGRAWHKLRGLPDRTPLRVKMITAVLVLVAAALAVISIAGITVIKDYLLNQSDRTLLSYSRQAEVSDEQYVVEGPPAWPFSPQSDLLWIPAGGKPQTVLGEYEGFHPDQAAGSPQPQVLSGPQVPSSTAWLAANNYSDVTVPAVSGGGRWRVLLFAVSYQGPNGAANGTVVVGVPVTSVYNAIGELTSLDFFVSGVLLLVILIVGIAAVRASLRPLTDIEKTAGAIAAGDLTRRVPDLDPRTEVGRLGRSLNIMLSQIETAFVDRTRSEEAARQSEQRMRQFLADASHELRTPLTAIRGFAEYYRQRGGIAELPAGQAGPSAGNGDGGVSAGTGPATPALPDVTATGRHAGYGPEGEGPLPRADLDRIMHRMEQESSRMSLLVEDMLLLARLDQQRPLERSTVDILSLAADAVHDARVVAPGRSINLTVGSGAALLVLGDEARLRQVIGNLMNNALSHTPEGSPIEVRVRLGSLDEWRAASARAHFGREHGASQAAVAVAVTSANQDAPAFPAVVFEIADQGAGLTQSQADHVFERFYRVDQARTRQSGGAGLGLAIVAGLVAAHGGAVWVESRAGDGATFRIALPLAPEARQSGPDPDDATGPDLLGSGPPLESRPGPRAEGRHAGRPAPPPPPPPRAGQALASHPGPEPASYSGPEPASYQGPEPASYQGPEPASYQGPEPASYSGPEPASHPRRPSLPPLPKRRPGFSGHDHGRRPHKKRDY
jgi:two-component system, OmpR family, sensor kinase